MLQNSRNLSAELKIEFVTKVSWEPFRVGKVKRPEAWKSWAVKQWNTPNFAAQRSSRGGGLSRAAKATPQQRVNSRAPTK